MIYGPGVVEDLVCGIEEHLKGATAGYSRRLTPTSAALGCVPYFYDVEDATIEVKVIGFDEGTRRVKLSRKRTLPHPYDVYKRQHSIGEAADFTVTRLSKAQVNVHHASGAPRVRHVSQLEPARVADASEKFRPGDSALATARPERRLPRQPTISVGGSCQQLNVSAFAVTPDITVSRRGSSAPAAPREYG